MDINELGLTEKDLTKVNTIISGIQSDLDNTIKSLIKGDFDAALMYVKSGLSKSNCPICKKQIGLLKADIAHNKEVCILDKEMCISETEELIKTATVLKNEFIPITTSKKAEKDIKKERVKKALKLPEFLPQLFFRRK